MILLKYIGKGLKNLTGPRATIWSHVTLSRSTLSYIYEAKHNTLRNMLIQDN